ncbi:MAG: ABC transporter ATP-binding protein [Bacilli bacterium]|nr:ABC transporter ATP-binding protein [Bacilli bacterium]MBN2696574.1 ABC transporter ATP-binding protein [Bacilli bacterium]
MNKNATNPQTKNKNVPRPGGRSGGGPGQGMPLGRPAEKAKDFKGTIKRLMKFLKPQIVLLTIMVILTVVMTLLGVIAPNYTREILNTMQGLLDGTVGNEGLIVIRNLFITIIVIYIVNFVMELIAHLVGNQVSATTGKTFRNVLREKLERLPISYFDRSQTGNVLSIFSNDVEAVTNVIQQSMIQIIQSFLMIVGVLVMMFIISWQLTIISMIILPLYILTTSTIAKRSQSRFIRQQRELGNINGYIEEMYTGQKIVKLFGKELDSYNKFAKINDQLSVEMKSAQFLSGLIRPIMEFISNLGYVAIVIVGAILAGAAMPLLIGDITIFVTYHRRFMNPILNLANLINMLQSAVAGAERIFDLLDAEEEVLEQKLKEFAPETFSGKVEFNDVDFSYLPEQSLIKNLNLEVEPGKQIAIVGPTGAGKTTLVNLLMRFYEIDKGKITIDGIQTTDVTRSELRSLFGMVLQDTWLFAGTIRENVAYGKDDATLEEVIEACKQAHVHHFIETLPHGYETILNEDASNISQGQKQLLTIARAILFNPRILILDEATSSVDTRTESYIQNAMNYMIQGKTSFVIAHRLSTIKRASTILVMQHGEIVEQGNHEELLARKGAYYELYQSQFVQPMI